MFKSKWKYSKRRSNIDFIYYIDNKKIKIKNISELIIKNEHLFDIDKYEIDYWDSISLYNKLYDINIHNSINKDEDYILQLSILYIDDISTPLYSMPIRDNIMVGYDLDFLKVIG